MPTLAEMNAMSGKQHLIPIKDRVVQTFEAENWREIGILTSCDDMISNHSRLLRSLHFGDDDYAGCALDVIIAMYNKDPATIDALQEYMDKLFPDSADGLDVSSHVVQKPKVVFRPLVFDVPSEAPRKDLVSVMMPFARNFDAVYEAIKGAASDCNLDCQRVDDIWDQSTVIQDVFGLIFRSYIVVCDFSGKNANVFYEAGIAHTLGKHVVPITQYKEDIPFDLSHHRFQHYHGNSEGVAKLRDALRGRFNHLISQP